MFGVFASWESEDAMPHWVVNAWESFGGAAVVIAFGYTLSIWCGGVLVRVFLARLGPPVKIDEGLRNAGRSIGHFERFLVTTLAVLDQFNAIAFVFAAKSIVRIKKVESEPRFAECYLAGTLASVSVGILIGLGIKAGLALLG